MQLKETPPPSGSPPPQTERRHRPSCVRRPWAQDGVLGVLFCLRWGERKGPEPQGEASRRERLRTGAGEQSTCSPSARSGRTPPHLEPGGAARCRVCNAMTRHGSSLVPSFLDDFGRCLPVCGISGSRMRSDGDRGVATNNEPFPRGPPSYFQPLRVPV